MFVSGAPNEHRGHSYPSEIVVALHFLIIVIMVKVPQLPCPKIVVGGKQRHAFCINICSKITSFMEVAGKLQC